ncbi:hypothetical protein F5Y14DRAFT_457987 [Nemania sp. NC0429]|nr:hypothetical protein F5Y14DRAFT_457987 [Nemania sp. NC0429]
MDPFYKLPAELRLEILLATGSKHSILQLAQASPAILRSYNASKDYIYRHLLSADTDFEEGMMNDAIAIILFPTCDQPGFYDLPESPRDFCSLHVQIHYELWLAGWHGSNWEKMKTCMNPGDRNLQPKIDDLYHRFLFYIEDYLTKATSACPPREYLCLPSRQGQLMFQDRVITRNRFYAAKCSKAERRRLLKAFLKYELMCKFLEWVEDGPRSLRKCLANEERRDMSCVRAYLQSLYKATILQCSNPDYADAAANLVALSHFDDKDIYARFDPTPELPYSPWDFKHEPIFWSWSQNNSEVLTYCLACYGFSLATAIVKATTDGRNGRAIINGWLRDVASIAGDCFWDMNERSKYMSYLLRIQGPDVRPPTRRQKYRARPFLDDDRFFELQETDVPGHDTIFTSIWFCNIVGPVEGICIHRDSGYFDPQEEETDIVEALAGNDPGV